MPVRVKSKPDLTAKIINRLKSVQGKNIGTHEVTRSTDEDSSAAIRYVVTTGIRPFDDRVGGMPVGKAIELMGPPSCGKTNMAVRTAARAQQGHIYERIPSEDGSTFELKKLEEGTYNVTVLYYDNEGSLADPWMKVVDGHRLDAAVDQCDTVDMLWKTLEATLDAVDEEQKATPKIIQFLIVIIDTVASISASEDLKAEWGKRDFPRQPKQLKEGLGYIIRRLAQDNVLLMGINHVSKKMDGMRGPPAYRSWDKNAPGGNAFKYYSHHRVYFEMLMTKYRMAKKGGADGMLVYFFTEKNRLRPMFREGRLSLLFGERNMATGQIVREGGFSDLYSVLETLIYSKVAEVSKETGAISFKFIKHGIQTTTFTPQGKTLEEQEDEEKPSDNPRRGARRFKKQSADEEEDATGALLKKDPRIHNRLEWPEFYAAHEADILALYDYANRQAFNQGMTFETLKGVGDDVEEEAGED